MSNNRRRETYFGRIKHFGRHEALELSGTAISEMCGVESRHSRPKLLACLGGTMPLVTTSQGRSTLATFLAFIEFRTFFESEPLKLNK